MDESDVATREFYRNFHVLTVPKFLFSANIEFVLLKILCISSVIYLVFSIFYRQTLTYLTSQWIPVDLNT